MSQRVPLPENHLLPVGGAMKEGVQILFNPVKGPGDLPGHPEGCERSEHQAQGYSPHPIGDPDRNPGRCSQRKKDPPANKPEDSELCLFSNDQAQGIAPFGSPSHDLQLYHVKTRHPVGVLNRDSPLGCRFEKLVDRADQRRRTLRQEIADHIGHRGAQRPHPRERCQQTNEENKNKIAYPGPTCVRQTL